jgi:hypothetical protein
MRCLIMKRLAGFSAIAAANAARARRVVSRAILGGDEDN